jgi:hypothetical protein
MRRALRLTTFIAAASGLASPPCTAQDPVADFYRGKQISILMGFSPGGSSSLYAAE